MNFIQQGYKGKNDWWRWVIILGLFLIPYFREFLYSYLLKPVLIFLPDFENKNILFSYLVYLILLPLFIASFKLLHKRDFITLITHRKKIDWLRFWFSFTSWGILSVLMFAVSLFISPEEYKFNFKALPFLGLLVICLVLVPIKVFFFTIFLRSYLLQLINVLFKKPILSLTAIVILFSFLMYNAYLRTDENINLLQLMHYVILGFLLGLIIILDDGLEIVLGMSLITTFVSVLFIGYKVPTYSSNALFLKDGKTEDYLIYIVCFIAYPLYFYFLSRLYRWSNWKEKLFKKVKNPIL